VSWSWMESKVDMLILALQSVNCVRFNADSSVLLSGSYDKTIRAWDIRLKRCSRNADGSCGLTRDAVLP
jgi:WD40 repeat protein